MFINAATFDTLRSVAFGSLTTSYAILGSELSNPAVLIGFKNATDGTVLISFDGINDNLVLPPQSMAVYDLRTNAPGREGACDYLFPKSAAILVKYTGTAPSLGSFYAEVLLAIPRSD
ncbi:MAG: hypothetical protein KGI50_05245 [Patescibacteria group bacterium]|nr:hypothetical protein [Patescibacteria group bacterium]MDE2438735.1 hypothetical protein [Patescibacteria group bacterium]